MALENNRYETDNLTEAISDDVDTETEKSERNKKNDNAKGGKHNILILIFSFVIAMSIWLYVMSMEDGEYEKTINLVPVQIVGTTELEYSNNMSVISGYDNTVNVTLKGKRTDVNKYTVNDIYAYVDVSKIDSADRQMLTVSVEALPDVSITVISPTAIAVYADVIDTKDVPVVVKPYYTIDGAYFVDTDKITKSIDFVEVTGPVSVLQNVECAVAESNIGKLTGSVKSTTSIYLVDKKGTKIQNPYLKTDADMVEITIPVYLRKYIKLTYEYDEKVFEDYNLDISLEFDSVCIIGEVLKVSSIDEICVLTLTRSHFKEDQNGNYLPFEKSLDLKLPDGVKTEDDISSVYIRAEITKKKTDPPVSEPTVTTPSASEPSVTNPSVTEPVTPASDVTEPAVTDAVISAPVETQSP